MIRWMARIGVTLLACAAVASASAQEGHGAVRQLTPAETGCDTAKGVAPDSVYEAEEVDRPVEARRLEINEMPLRVREVLSGHSTFRFVVEHSGRINLCSIELVEETSRTWSDAVLKELRAARYQPARKDGRSVRQRVYQVFTYHSDGRLQRPR